MGSTEKYLSDLGLTPLRGSDRPVRGLSSDSRSVVKGSLFAALPGTQVHGGRFIGQALENGAHTILTDRAGYEMARDVISSFNAAVVIAQDPRAALALTAALWFARQPEKVIAVTGTNGKTSVASFCQQIWAELGHSSVNIGTTGVEGAWTAPLAHTTPDPVTLHGILSAAAEAGITHAAMEASSHGLDQRRLEGVRLKAAGFTNISQDHLDYHDDFEAYFAAKTGLFDRVLPQDCPAVINSDTQKGLALAERLKQRDQQVITIGRNETADLRLMGQRFSPRGQDVRYQWHGAPFQAHLPLIGGFQAENVLLATGLVIASGHDPRDVFETLPHLVTVRGRMDFAAERLNGASVFVDYAHTPDAVKTAIEAFRPHVMGRLIAIIGAGGDRDRGKRPQMGALAAEASDHLIVTDDNPRSEDPAQIRKMVLAGIENADHVSEVGDRA
ncbi:MAG: UDP-N-acetylmuramoyl-L-alanyl-D-glutamate--2,6-diaminopimelate ligase, partial [Paracoccaceae bacterium]|nr:UDP-N-acetylmuramoyl-L-alanyl-D-glutamate--2,6-diaminopimelate ligase [Paracoccaceae bacterium]